jgi:flagellin
MSSLVAHTAQRSASRLHAQSMIRLSTGIRINSAQDDAAGLAIGARMTTTINACGRLIQDISNGVSLAQVAAGGLQSISGLLQRMRELAVQAASGTLAGSDRVALDQEFQALNGEIDRISKHTQIFERTPLAPLKPTPTVAPVPIGNTSPINSVLTSFNRNFSSGLASLGYIPKGFSHVTINLDSFGADDDLQIFTSDGKHLLGTPILTNTDPVWSAKGITSASAANSQIMNAGNAFAAGASYDGSFLPPANGYDTNALPIVNQYNGMALAYSGDGQSSSRYLEKITIDTVTENLVVMVIGNGSFSANGTWTEPPVVVPSNDPFSEDTAIVLSSPIGQASQILTMTGTPSDTVTLGTANSHIQTTIAANTALNELDSAINLVNEYAVKYGAWTSRFSSAGVNLQEMVTQSSASRSRIMDADYAVESARLAAQKILQKASHAVIAQANELPRSVLSLLEQK